MEYVLRGTVEEWGDIYLYEDWGTLGIAVKGDNGGY